MYVKFLVFLLLFTGVSIAKILAWARLDSVMPEEWMFVVYKKGLLVVQLPSLPYLQIRCSFFSRLTLSNPKWYGTLSGLVQFSITLAQYTGDMQC